MPTARPSTGEQPGSGAKHNEGAQIWTTRIWQVDKGTGAGFVPPMKESTADGYFQRFAIAPGVAQWELLTLEFVDSLSGSGIVRSDGDSRWTLSAPCEVVPLAALGTAYRVKWEYDLYIRATEKAGYSQPAWWTTAANLANADGITYLWAKDDPGEYWARVEVRTKPGIEGWHEPHPVARYEYWNATKATAIAQLKAVGHLFTPSETFGYTGGSWLVTHAEVSEDAGKWRATVEYTWSPAGWDTDIYS
jgi:hypothetical protein